MKYSTEVAKRNDPNWPIEDMRELYPLAVAENPILKAGGTKAIDYEYGPQAWAVKVLDEAGKVVGGCIFEFWDNHLDNCLTVHAAFIKPDHRYTGAAAAMWRTLRWYAMGCQWIHTYHYVGNNTYVTKYREIKL